MYVVLDTTVLTSDKQFTQSSWRLLGSRPERFRIGFEDPVRRLRGYASSGHKPRLHRPPRPVIGVGSGESNRGSEVEGTVVVTAQQVEDPANPLLPHGRFRPYAVGAAGWLNHVDRQA